MISEKKEQKKSTACMCMRENEKETDVCMKLAYLFKYKF